MLLSEHERNNLIAAIEYLRDGDRPNFEYALWVGFGDTWHAVRERLVREGFVTPAGRRTPPAPTPRTDELERRLRDQHAHADAPELTPERCAA